jgi:hypothetical protein
MQTKVKLPLVTLAQWARWIFKISGHVCGCLLESHPSLRRQPRHFRAKIRAELNPHIADT